MALPSFDDLHARVDRIRPQIGVAVAGGNDLTVLEALAWGLGHGWIRPFVSGDREEIEQIAGNGGLSLQGFQFLSGDSPAEAAVGAVSRGEAAILMKGQVDTPSLMRALLNPQANLRTGQTISQVVMMEVSDQQRRFLLSDTGITISPNRQQKGEIVQHCVRMAQRLGVDCPRVGLVCATEKVNSNMPETLDIVELVERSRAGAFGECMVEGPLSFDLAYANEAGEKKRVSGRVVGAADVMVFPNLLAGNLTVKAIMYTARCRFGGILVGAKCPVVFMSRADTTATRIDSLALALSLIS